MTTAVSKVFICRPTRTALLGPAAPGDGKRGGVWCGVARAVHDVCCPCGMAACAQPADYVCSGTLACRQRWSMCWWHKGRIELGAEQEGAKSMLGLSGSVENCGNILWKLSKLATMLICCNEIWYVCAWQLWNACNCDWHKGRSFVQARRPCLCMHASRKLSTCAPYEASSWWLCIISQSSPQFACHVLPKRHLSRTFC